MAASPSVPSLVSVIIPALNASATLGRALDSVAAQTYPQWEAIVVDDGSDDDTVAFVERRGDPRCRVIRRATRGGPSRARNDGIAAAQGEFIAFLDADDEWLPEKLARQGAIFARDPAVSLVTCDMRSIYEDGSEGLSIFARQSPVEGETAWKTLLASSFVGTSSVMTRRALLDQIGGFDPTLAVGEDQDLFIRLAMRGKVAALPEKLAIYHYRRASYSAAYATEQAAHVLRMVRRHLDAAGERLSPRERRSILARRYGRLGRNLIAAGARGRGAWLILAAAMRGNLSRENLAALAMLTR
jgi:glycosyltransferase involved in cell wall biosynthesis